MERIILHCDMNNYFASVEEKFNPKLKKIPFAVCGDPEMRHSIVMAKNSLAKKAGVITGLSFRQAKEICPDLEYVRAEYPRYLTETKAARDIYRKYTDTVIPYGLDEAWIDLSETGVSMNDARQIADLIRLEIMYSRGLSASVGVSDNLIFAKLGSDYKKPNATTVITRDNFKSLVWPLPVSDLLFVGRKRAGILAEIGITTIGELASANPDVLTWRLGKAGYDLHRFANGDDCGFHPENDTIRSVGNTITTPEDLHCREDAAAVIYLVSGSVSARLIKHQLKASCIALVMKDSRFNTFTRQCAIPYPTDSTERIFRYALGLLLRNYTWENPLRSVGVRASGLTSTDFEQLTMDDPGKIDYSDGIDERIKQLTKRFGKLNVENSAAARE